MQEKDTSIPSVFLFINLELCVCVCVYDKITLEVSRHKLREPIKDTTE